MKRQNHPTLSSLPLTIPDHRVNLQPGPLKIPKNPPPKSPARLRAAPLDDDRSSISSISDQSVGAGPVRAGSLVSPISLQKNLQPLSLDFHMHSHFHHVSSETTPSDSDLSSSANSSDENDILDEYLDGASSCYSRRSSLTSMESEYPGVACRSADAFSIGSPVAAGVFEDTASVQGFKSSSQSNSAVSERRTNHPWKRMVKKKPSIAEVKNKPLPQEPPIQMAPLSLRNTGDTANTTVNSGGGTRNGGRSIAPLSHTLSQAAHDLENALSSITTTTTTATDTTADTNAQTKEAKHARNAETALLNSPLQISRGDMQMIASRPAPRPPLHTLPHSLQQQQQQKKSPKSPKMPFHLSVPGFGRKYGRLHLRSFSGSNLRSDMECDRGTVADTTTTTTTNNNNNTTTDNKDNKDSSVEECAGPELSQRPSSISSERELRLQLPRLQTKKMAPAHNTTTPATRPAMTPSHIDKTPETEMGGPVKPIVEEKIFVASSKLRRSNTFVLPYQPGSLQAPQIIYELDAGMPSPPVRVANSKPSSTVARPAILPDAIVHSILDQASSLDDVFNLAVLNRQFYRIFKQNELDFIKNAVFKMSPPAWELREMSPPWDSEWQGMLDPDAQVPDYTPTLYLQRYAQDIFTLAQLKSLILARCSSFLRPDTIRGLAGVDFDRATEVDDAFWRIWTFCRIFGCGKGRENDIDGQTDWLNGGVLAMNQHTSLPFSVSEPFGMNNVLFEPPAGFAMGNVGGLSQSQMYDMTELFTCLSVLLQPLHGKCGEARRAGIFNRVDVKVGDSDKEEKILEEWTAYVLTLGLSAVLSLGSICPIKNASTTFQKARAMGLTKWDLADGEITRSSFLKEAVSRSYKSREDTASSQQSVRSSGASASSSSWSVAQDQSSQSSAGSSTSDQPVQEHRVRQAAFAVQLRNQRAQPRHPAYTSFADERPISSYTVVMNGLEGIPQRQKSRAPLSPMPTQPNQRVYPQPSPPPPVAPAPAVAPVQTPQMQTQVLDPVDRALEMMVGQLGFNEKDAKWALKITDTGEGIDTHAAVSLLTREGRNQAHASNQGSLLSSVISEEPANGWRWA